jgi:hypothetical protein
MGPLGPDLDAWRGRLSSECVLIAEVQGQLRVCSRRAWRLSNAPIKNPPPRKLRITPEFINGALRRPARRMRDTRFRSTPNPARRAEAQQQRNSVFGAGEIQLLYKAKHVRPRDELDFEAVTPELSDEARRWLLQSLARTLPSHAWTHALERYPVT